MCKLWKGLKNRYHDGIEWMKLGEGLPSMMYLATTIAILLVFFIVMPENAMQYLLTGTACMIVVYWYSFLMSRRFVHGMDRMIPLLGIIAIVCFGVEILGSGLNFWLLVVLFVIPVIVACGMIFLQENCLSLEDFFAFNCSSTFEVVIISALLPTIVIILPLFFLEWSIFTKIAIVLGYILIAPLICWADDNNYGIFGALGIEW